jgi:hypothetical protein
VSPAQVWWGTHALPPQVEAQLPAVVLTSPIFSQQQCNAWLDGITGTLPAQLQSKADFDCISTP